MLVKDNPWLKLEMLAEKKKKMRLPLDPNNKTWTEDTSSFGRKMLEKMGWKSGQGLGLNADGTTTHIKISLKEDNLGIGASKKDSEGAWLNNSKGYQEVLDRLSKSIEEQTKKADEKDQKNKKKDKKADKKSDKKNKSDTKKDKKKDKKNKDEKSTSAVSVQKHTQTVLKSAHRAKFIRNKAVSSYSEASLKEILGGINI